MVRSAEEGADRCVWCGGAVHRAFALWGGFRYRRCGRCGSLQIEPRPTTAQTEAHYAVSYAVDPDPEVLASNALHYEEATTAGNPGSPGIGLEVGAGHGAWAAYRASFGWKMAVVEPSLALEPLLRQGFEYLGGEIERVEPSARFDEVIEAHVIEHVSDLDAHLRALAGQLKPGGLLRLLTPNAGSWKCRVLGSLWLWALVEHLQIASPRGIRAAVERAGLEVVECVSFVPPPQGYPGLVIGAVSWVKNQLKNYSATTCEQDVNGAANTDSVRKPEPEDGIAEQGVRRVGRLGWLFEFLARLSRIEARLLMPLDRLLNRRFAGDELVLLARKPLE